MSDKMESLLKFDGFGQAMEASKLLAGSALVPDAYRGRPADVLICWQYGAEVGLQPMQALQSIAVINGRPGLYGDGMLAVCQAHNAWRGKEETYDPKTKSCTCVVRRHGEPDVESTFSMTDAQTAGLAGKKGPWSQYPKRMLQMRARAFALRDQFADALKGMRSADELRDMDVQAADTPVPAKATTIHFGRKALPAPPAAELPPAPAPAPMRATERPEVTVPELGAEVTGALNYLADHGVALDRVLRALGAASVDAIDEGGLDEIRTRCRDVIAERMTYDEAFPALSAAPAQVGTISSGRKKVTSRKAQLEEAAAKAAELRAGAARDAQADAAAERIPELPPEPGSRG